MGFLHDFTGTILTRRSLTSRWAASELPEQDLSVCWRIQKLTPIILSDISIDSLCIDSSRTNLAQQLRQSPHGIILYAITRHISPGVHDGDDLLLLLLSCSSLQTLNLTSATYATMVLAVALSYFQLGCSTPTVL